MHETAGTKIPLRTFRDKAIAVVAALLASILLVACAQGPSAQPERDTTPIEEQQGPGSPISRERRTDCIPIELYDVASDVTTLTEGVVCEETASSP